MVSGGPMGDTGPVVGEDEQQSFVLQRFAALGKRYDDPDGADATLRGRVESRLFTRPSEPRQVSRYQLQARLGSGGFGVVYRAYDPELDRDVAIKLIRADRLRMLEAMGGRDRILREARAIARLDHPNVVRVFDVGTGHEDVAVAAFGDTPTVEVFVVMELLEGQTLADWLDAELRAKATILEVFEAAGRGLAAAHEAGIVHRDFKPSNVIVTPRRAGTWEVRVLDFGLARFAPDTEDDFVTASHSASWSGDIITAPSVEGGTFRAAGTPAYMAPEVHRGASGDTRADQYSFCVALVEALIGERPFKGRDTRSLYEAKVVGIDARRLESRGVSAPMAAVLLRGLAVRPEDRHPDMASLLRALSRAAKPERPRTKIVGIGLGSLIVVGSSIGAWSWTQGDDDCEATAAKVEDVWSADVRSTISAALERTDPRFGADSWRTVRRHVDRFAADWATAVGAACAAAQPRTPEASTRLDAQMACLNAQRSELEVLVEVLLEPEAGDALRAPAAAARLGVPLSCLNVDETQSEPAPPRDATVRTEVARLRTMLGRARGYYATGRYDRGVEMLEGIRAEAEAIDYPPLHAEIGYRLGALQVAAGELEAGRALLEEAWTTATAARHDRLAAVVAARLVSVYGYHLGRIDDAFVWARHAEAALDRAGHPEPTEAQLVHNLGLLYSSQGRFAEAEAQYRRALALYRAAEGDRDPDVATCLNNLGATARLLGRSDEALVHFGRSLEIIASTYGRTHPDYAATTANRAMVLVDLGRLDEALEDQQRVVRLREAVQGPEHPSTVGALTNLAVVRYHRGELERAEEIQRQALDVGMEALDADHPNVVRMLDNMNTILREQGRLDEALDFGSRAHAVTLRVLGLGDHPDAISPLVNLGRTLVELDRLEEARLRIDEALALEPKLPPRDQRRPYLRVAAAELAAARGDWTGAEQLLRDALELWLEVDAPAIVKAPAQFTLARVLAEQGGAASNTAYALADEAGRAYARSGPSHRAIAEHIHSWKRQHAPD